MIRREITLTEDERSWLLISQVDHAHLSGEITQHGSTPFSQDAIDAITHHDDGWIEWESAPRINPSIGAPYSFLEMPLAESLHIWDSSIAAARMFGPLAGFLVAGHFYGLLSESEHRSEPSAIAWLAAKRKVRTAWLDEWVRLNPAHTLDVAKAGQAQLLTADLFSLWLCCDAPTGGEDAGILQQTPTKFLAESLLKHYRFTTVGFGRRHPTPDNPNEALAWVIVVDPYPFQESAISLTLKAILAPVARYKNWQEIDSASRPIQLRWRLMPPISPKPQ